MKQKTLRQKADRMRESVKQSKYVRDVLRPKLKKEGLLFPLKTECTNCGIKVEGEFCSQECKTKWNNIQKEVKHLRKSKIPRCMNCKKNFVKESEYTWKPTCKCTKDLRVSIG